MARKKFYETDEFKKLNCEWESKLKKSGFVDTEKSEVDNIIRPQEFDKNNKQYVGGIDYYQLCSQILREFVFKKEIHRQIFELHSEGKSEYEIRDWLKSNSKQTRSQKGINLIINRVRDQFIYGKKQ